MMFFLNDMRLSLIDFIKRMKPGGVIDANFLMKMLLFENEDDALGFMVSCGFTDF